MSSPDATTQPPSPEPVNPKEGLRPTAQVAGASAISGFLLGSTTGLLRSSPPLLFGTATALQWTLLSSIFTYTRFSYLNYPGFSAYYAQNSGQQRQPGRRVGAPARDARLADEIPKVFTGRKRGEGGMREVMGNGADYGEEVEHTPRELLKASVVAGATAGGVSGLLLRGPRNIIPGSIMFALFGGLGQTLFTTLSPSPSASTQETSQTSQTSPQLPSSQSSQTPPRTPDNATQPNLLQRLASSKWTPGVKTLSDEEYEGLLRERLLRVEAEIAVVDEKKERIAKEQVQKGKSEHALVGGESNS